MRHLHVCCYSFTCKFCHITLTAWPVPFGSSASSSFFLLQMSLSLTFNSFTAICYVGSLCHICIMALCLHHGVALCTYVLMLLRLNVRLNSGMSCCVRLSIPNFLHSHCVGYMCPWFHFSHLCQYPTTCHTCCGACVCSLHLQCFIHSTTWILWRGVFFWCTIIWSCQLFLFCTTMVTHVVA